MAIQYSRKVLLIAGVFILTGSALASPTSDEFRRCHEISTVSLRECMDARAGYTSNALNTCWVSARKMQISCYRMVQNQYVVDKEKIAKRRAAERSEQERIQRELEAHKAEHNP